MCKKFKFDHTNKWYMHNLAPVLEKVTHKLLWDFNIQTDHQIPARRPDLIIINKKKANLQNYRLCCPGWPQNKSEGMWKEGLVPRLCKRIEKAVEYGTITKGLLKGPEDLEVGERVETIQKTALVRTARILRRVLETCCHSSCHENHLLTLMWKILKIW